MADWTFILCDRMGNALSELAITPIIHWQVNRPARITFPLYGEQRASYQLIDTLTKTGIPQIKCYRDPPLWPGQSGPSIAMRGWWNLQSDAGYPNVVVGNVDFRGPLEQLKHRWRGQGDFRDLTDQSYYIERILTLANRAQSHTQYHGGPDGSPEGKTIFMSAQTGLLLGTKYFSVQRERANEIYATLWDEYMRLTEFVNGVETLEIPSVSDVVDGYANLCSLDVGGAGKFGTTKSNVKFQHGPGTLDNCEVVYRTLYPPVNVVTVLGTATTPDPLFKQYAQAISLASKEKYGLYKKIISDPSDNLAELTQRAEGLLRLDPSFTLKFEPSVPNNYEPGDYWLGDTIEFYADKESLQVPLSTQRIHGIEIEIDAHGGEVRHSLECGEVQPKWPVGTVESLSSRITKLENV